MKYLSILTLVIFTSCSANWHIQRAIKKDPLMKRDAKVITTYLDTTFITEGSKADTIIEYRTDFDTIVLENTKFKTEVIHDPIYKTIYVETECFSDTVYVSVPVEQTIIEVEDKNWFQKTKDRLNKWLVRTVLIILFILALVYFVKRWFKVM